ncbi:hypothetical protein PG988_000023 [Apiospora saccharicola]
MEWAAARTSASSPKTKGHGLVLLSSYYSPRTIKSMARVIGRQPRVIEVPHVSVNVGMDIIEEADCEHIKRLMGNQHAGRVVVHCHDDWNRYLRRSNINLAKLEDSLDSDDVIKILQSRNNVRRIAQGRQHVSVAAQFPYSFPLAGLRYIFSSYRVETLAFRPEVVQPVLQTRDVTQLEHLRELSWAHKAQVPDDVMFYRPEPYVSKPLASGVDSLGPAMLADRYRTVLEFLARWPGQTFTEMPTRNPQNMHYLRDVCRKLELFGCLEDVKVDGRPKHGAYRLSEFGAVLHELWELDELRSLDFHVVHLLVTAMSGMDNEANKWSHNMLRVAIRLAAIMSFAGQLCCKKNSDEPQSLQHLQDQCVGIGKTRAHLGGVWASLGIWQNAFNSNNVNPAVIRDVTMGTVMLNGSAAVGVFHLINSLEGVVGYNRLTDEIGGTSLTDAEADLVEDALLLAWIDQLAAYVRSQDMWHEAATVRETHVSNSGFLDPTRLNSKEHQYGCFAIYSRIEDKGEGIFLRELTAVSQRATKAFAARKGMFFTEAIASLYPVGRQHTYAD